MWIEFGFCFFEGYNVAKEMNKLGEFVLGIDSIILCLVDIIYLVVVFYWIFWSYNFIKRLL